MSDHSTYDALRHFADSWGLLAMMMLFIGFNAWTFRPGAGARNARAASMIFDDFGSAPQKDLDHGGA